MSPLLTGKVQTSNGVPQRFRTLLHAASTRAAPMPAMTGLCEGLPLHVCRQTRRYLGAPARLRRTDRLHVASTPSWLHRSMTGSMQRS